MLYHKLLWNLRRSRSQNKEKISRIKRRILVKNKDSKGSQVIMRKHNHSRILMVR